MNYETLLVDKDKRGVVSLTLNRPEKRNALSAKMIDELTNFAASLTSDIRVTVIQERVIYFVQAVIWSG